MRCSCENAKREARRDALEEAAELLDGWVAECDRTDCDEDWLAGHYEHAAEQIRALKKQDRR